jgi:hypothetical protein
MAARPSTDGRASDGTYLQADVREIEHILRRMEVAENNGALDGRIKIDSRTKDVVMRDRCLGVLVATFVSTAAAHNDRRRFRQGPVSLNGRRRQGDAPDDSGELAEAAERMSDADYAFRPTASCPSGNSWATSSTPITSSAARQSASHVRARDLELRNSR